MRARAIAGLSALLAIAAVPPAGADLVTPGTTTRVSVATDGGDPDGHSNSVVVSDDGRTVLFQSTATNLVTDGTGQFELYVRGPAGVVERVPAPPAADLPKLDFAFDLSGDGRFVVFSRTRGGDVDVRGVYLYDRTHDVLERISIDQNGVPIFGVHPTISNDGDTVVFRSSDSLRVWERAAGVSRPVTDADGAPLDSFTYALSGDGSMMVFEEHAPAPVFSVVLLLHLGTGEIEQISDGVNFSFFPAIGEDAIAYLRATGNSFLIDIVHVDLATRQERVLIGSAEAMGGASMSVDGSSIAFASLPLLAVDPRVVFPGVHVWLPHTNEVTLVSRSSEGVPSTSFPSGFASLSADGRFVAFGTADAHEPDDTNGLSDIYLHDRAGPCRVVCVLPG